MCNAYFKAIAKVDNQNVSGKSGFTNGTKNLPAYRNSVVKDLGNNCTKVTLKNQTVITRPVDFQAGHKTTRHTHKHRNSKKRRKNHFYFYFFIITLSFTITKKVYGMSCLRCSESLVDVSKFSLCMVLFWHAGDL